MIDSNSSVIRQKGEPQNGCFKKTKHTKFSEKRTFLTPWYRKIWRALFLETPVLRFALLPYYRRISSFILIMIWFTTFWAVKYLIFFPSCKQLWHDVKVSMFLKTFVKILPAPPWLSKRNYPKDKNICSN